MPRVPSSSASRTTSSTATPSRRSPMAERSTCSTITTRRGAERDFDAAPAPWDDVTMRRRRVSLLLPVFLSAVGCASVGPDAGERLDLEATSSAAVAVTWDDALTRPRRVRGEWATKAATPERAARDFLEAHAALFQ